MTANKQLFRLLAVCTAAILLPIITGCSREHLNKENAYGLSNDPYPVAPKKTAPVLHVALWKDSIDPDMLAAFENRYGVKLEVTLYQRASELLEIIQKQPDGWDVFMTNQYTSEYLNKKELLQPIKRLNPFIYRYINTSVINPKADPQMRYFIPYNYAAFGIAFNTDYMAGFPKDWHYISAHDDNPYIYGRIVISDDMRFAFSTAMLYLGLDPNSRKPEDIEKAKVMLIKWVNDYGLRFVPFTVVSDELKKENALMAITWSGTGGAILQSKQECRFLLPEGKCIISVDGFCIPRRSKNEETAALFIEFMMHPYVSMMNANNSMFASTNIRAMRYVSRFIINGPSSLLPYTNDMVFISYLANDDLVHYENAWAEVKAAAMDPDKIKIIPVN